MQRNKNHAWARTFPFTSDVHFSSAVLYSHSELFYHHIFLTTIHVCQLLVFICEWISMNEVINNLSVCANTHYSSPLWILILPVCLRSSLSRTLCLNTSNFINTHKYSIANVDFKYFILKIVVLWKLSRFIHCLTFCPTWRNCSCTKDTRCRNDRWCGASGVKETICEPSFHCFPKHAILWVH